METATTTAAYQEKLVHSCDNCGAIIEVNVTKQSGCNEREYYYCPECDKRFYTRASKPIADIKIVKPRADELTTKCWNPPLQD